MQEITQEQEEWRVIEEFPDYAVSNMGRVKTIRTEKIKSIYINNYGYCRVYLRKNNKGYIKSVHRLVYKSFLGEIGIGKEINHINGIKIDNRPQNIECITGIENKRHAWRLGLYKPSIHSEETKDKIRRGRLGKKHSDNTKEKIRDMNLGRKLSAETKEKIRISSTGRIHSEKSKQKIRDGIKKAFLNPLIRQKLIGHNVKLKKDDVLYIKQYLSNNNYRGTVSKLAKKFNVDWSTIDAIKKGKSFGYINANF